MAVKANRTLRREEQAVSPVLGAILGVAIAVVLAGSVWFLLGILTRSSSTDASPQIGFTRQGTSLVVAKAPAKALDWYSDIRPSGTCAAALQLAPQGGAAAPYPTAAGTKVSSGDKLSGCTSGQTLTLADISTNRVIFTTTF